MKILGTQLNSKCMYCNSESYGKSCIYAPHKIHVHVDDPKRCIYCGSVSFGPSCIYNPFSKVHVHGMEYNQATCESLHKNVVANVLLSKLFDTTLNESNDLIDRFVYKIQSLLGKNKLEFISDLQLLESKCNTTKKDMTIKDIELSKQFELRSNKLLNNLNDLITEYKVNENVDIDNILFENLINIIKQ